MGHHRMFVTHMLFDGDGDCNPRNKGDDWFDGGSRILAVKV